MIKVSVIIPVYNAEKYLKQMLNSVCAQTLRQIEIICVDDGSEDASLRILKAFAGRDRRIIVMEQEHAGAGAARNLGIHAAKGDYLSILDADDFFEPDMLEKAWSACEHSGADVCVFRSDCYHTKTRRYEDMPWTAGELLLENHPFRPQEIYPCAFQAFYGWAWDKLYRRTMVTESRLEFQTIRTSNDAFFVFLMNLQAERIIVLDKKLVHHRTDVETSLSVTREQSWKCCWQAVHAIQKELKARGLYDAVEQSFINWALHFMLWNVHSMKSAEAKRKLYHNMREKYFPALELEKHAQSFFYHSDEYAEYRNICQPDSLRKTAAQLCFRIRRKLSSWRGIVHAWKRK